MATTCWPPGWPGNEQVCQALLFCFGSPRREQAARRAQRRQRGGGVPVEVRCAPGFAAACPAKPPRTCFARPARAKGGPRRTIAGRVTVALYARVPGRKRPVPPAPSVVPPRRRATGQRASTPHPVRPFSKTSAHGPAELAATLPPLTETEVIAVARLAARLDAAISEEPTA